MSKFKVGDRIFDHLKGEGEITKVRLNASGTNTYDILWDKYRNEETWPFDIAENRWAFSESKVPALPTNGYGAPKTSSSKVMIGKNARLMVGGKEVGFLGDVTVTQEIKEDGTLTSISGQRTFNGTWESIGQCNHTPIDVGFVRPKMVCSKCNEDL